jgi:hypothetical protein
MAAISCWSSAGLKLVGLPPACLVEVVFAVVELGFGIGQLYRASSYKNIILFNFYGCILQAMV